MNKKSFLSKLRKAELLHNDLPDELRTDFDVIKAERKAKTRLLSNRGCIKMNSIISIIWIE